MNHERTEIKQKNNRVSSLDWLTSSCIRTLFFYQRVVVPWPSQKYTCIWIGGELWETLWSRTRQTWFIHSYDVHIYIYIYIYIYVYAQSKLKKKQTTTERVNIISHSHRKLDRDKDKDKSASRWRWQYTIHVLLRSPSHMYINTEPNTNKQTKSKSRTKTKYTYIQRSSTHHYIYWEKKSLSIYLSIYLHRPPMQ